MGDYYDGPDQVLDPPPNQTGLTIVLSRSFPLYDFQRSPSPCSFFLQDFNLLVPWVGISDRDSSLSPLNFQSGALPIEQSGAGIQTGRTITPQNVWQQPDKYLETATYKCTCILIIWLQTLDKTGVIDLYVHALNVNNAAILFKKSIHIINMHIDNSTDKYLMAGRNYVVAMNAYLLRTHTYQNNYVLQKILQKISGSCQKLCGDQHMKYFSHHKMYVATVGFRSVNKP